MQACMWTKKAHLHHLRLFGCNKVQFGPKGLACTVKALGLKVCIRVSELRQAPRLSVFGFRAVRALGLQVSVSAFSQ